MIHSLNKPTVTIIVATLNAGRTLQCCIDSVNRQIWPEKELIVCDGGSTDSTVDILKRNTRSITYWCSEPDNGIYNAWNNALLHVSGDWICFLGADDYFWSPTVLSACMAASTIIYPDIRIIYGQVALVREGGSVLRLMGRPWEQVEKKFRQLNCVPHPGLLCHREVFEEHGNFDESFRISGDYEFLLRELLYRKAYFIPGLITVGMRTGGISGRSRTLRLGYEECRRAQKMHNVRSPDHYWLLGYTVALVRWAVARIIGEQRVDNFVNWLRHFGAGLKIG
jgi:glycosyltransferase involved in cell wall biosynthesis